MFSVKEGDFIGRKACPGTLLISTRLLNNGWQEDIIVCSARDAVQENLVLGRLLNKVENLEMSDFLILYKNGDGILADALGSNIAFSCWSCGHPVLAIARPNQPGSDENHPARCKGCV
ncbi:hypothetical protein QWY82_07370 [Simiduia curdlanivorans]|uniref:Uncharacterized protein n=1 Tax=Simiduia curdlanivorans TaxID=1492769 RepID=A0ABV8V7N3_9GAMM|nr:hypothetical protein [Simiduia curdlanivorans]MDN3638621.1 hypothetical protein [Simiduia curdlanivorans]